VIKNALLAALVAAGGCAGATDKSATEQSASPAKVVRSVAVSGSHACALREAGLYCWGDNRYGQLGDGTTMDSSTPVRAELETDDVVEVAASTGRTCVRRSGGAIECWGDNGEGQAGDGTRRQALAPIAAMGIDDAIQLAVDDLTTCALREGGEVMCWGGSPDSAPERGSLEPRAIEGLANVEELRGGVIDLYCARDAGDEVSCFRLEGDDWQPAFKVPALSGARAIAVTGNDEVCALTPQHTALCHNLTTGNDVPLTGGEDLVELVGTSLVACAKEEGGAWTCWNILPALLDMVGAIAIPVEVDVPLVEVAIGGFQVCALREDGSIGCANAETGKPEIKVIGELPQ
jgi:hypothetical protein